jgi:hypothetical protein
VVDQDELQHAFTGLFDLGGVGRNHHAIGHNCRAGGHWFGDFLHLHQAHAAISFHLQLRMIAKIWDLNPQPFGGLDEVRPRLHRDIAIVDLHRRHMLILSSGSSRGCPLCATAY